MEKKSKKKGGCKNPLIKYNMKTELTEITNQLHTYMHSNNQEEIDRAEVYLKKIHNKYGTVDVVQIKNIIK